MPEKWREDLSLPLIDFSTVESRIFTQENGKFFIGGVEITPQVKDLLKEQARYIQSSQLFELLNATIVNEAGNLALVQSANCIIGIMF
jgi:hypothetical protein